MGGVDRTTHHWASRLIFNETDDEREARPFIHAKSAATLVGMIHLQFPNDPGWHKNLIAPFDA
jgi:hypothetical protein